MERTRERRRTPARALLALVTLTTTAAQAQLPPRALPACGQVGQQVTLTLNTGSIGPLPPPGTADPIWRVAPSIIPFTTDPHSAWVPNSANPKWIQRAPGGNLVNFPVQTHIYTTQFTTPVDPYLYSSITITGSFAADDRAVVRLNGAVIATCIPGSTQASWCFNSWKPIPLGVSWPAFNRTSPFLNTLTIEVRNTLAASPSGLIVRARIVAVCSKCTSPVPPPPCGGDPSTC